MAHRSRRVKPSRRRPAQQAPVIISEDSVAVTIRFSPQKINGFWYNSWIVDYWMHGARHRDRKNSFRKARTWAVTVANKMANGEIEALELTGEDRRIYLASLENIKGLGIPLDAATREYADAKRLVKKADLREVSRFHNRYAQKGVKAIKVPALVKKLITDLEADARSDYHVRDSRLLVHELAHVAQYERLGGFHGFLKQYLEECINPGYPLGDLEQEAKQAESSQY